MSGKTTDFLPVPKTHHGDPKVWNAQVAQIGYSHACAHDFEDWLKVNLGKTDLAGSALMKKIIGLPAQQAAAMLDAEPDQWKDFIVWVMARNWEPWQLAKFGVWFKESRVPREHMMAILKEWMED